MTQKGDDYRVPLTCRQTGLTDKKQIIQTDEKDIYNSIIAGRLPSLWASKSYPSLKSLGNYITDLCARINFFQVRFCLKENVISTQKR